MYNSGFVKEKPSKAPGSMAAMMLASTGLSLQGSLVNSGSKLSWFFFPFCGGQSQWLSEREGGGGTDVLGAIGRLDLSPGQLLPVHVLEEWLALYLLSPFLCVTAQPLTSILAQELREREEGKGR